MSSISLLNLHQFHTIDRTLFTRLVKYLLRDPAQSILAMAFWIWLERNHFPCLTTRLLNASDYVVNKISDEAIICLNSLAPNQPMPGIIDTTFTTTLMGRTVPLDMMHRDKSSTINGIKQLLTDVCARIFTDILEQLITVRDSEALQVYSPINVHGFPHPIFGNVTFLKLPPDEIFPVGNPWGWNIPV